MPSQEGSRAVKLRMRVNGEAHACEIWPGERLLLVRRERVDLPLKKRSANRGVLLFSMTPLCALCLVLAVQANEAAYA
ncbi:MAG: hypothetical protein E6G67_02205 [Actinobacteria bacterium]|nr:MAG: hypothetical protein E6G67_02205 [Actinomycetota bacterium]